jgi:hypothetical protein
MAATVRKLWMAFCIFKGSVLLMPIPPYVFLYRVQQASFLFFILHSVQNRKLACRTLLVLHYLHLMFNNCPFCPVQNEAKSVRIMKTNHHMPGIQAVPKRPGMLSVLQAMGSAQWPTNLYNLSTIVTGH